MAELAISYTLIVQDESGALAPSFECLQSLTGTYRTSAAALLVAWLEQASAEEIAQFIQLVNDTCET